LELGGFYKLPLTPKAYINGVNVTHNKFDAEDGLQ
jgi:hypothetical protein